MEERDKKALGALLNAVVVALLIVAGFQLLAGGKKEKGRETETKTPVKSESVVIPSKNKGKLVSVETPLYRAVFSTVNGKLIGFNVKKYGVELIPDYTNTIHIYPLMTISADKALSAELVELELTPSSTSLKVENQPATLKFTGTVPDGRKLIKTFVFYPDSYRIDFEVNLDGEKLITIAGVGLKTSQQKSSRMGHAGPVVMVNGEVFRLKSSELRNFLTFSNARWAGSEDKYFVMAIKNSGFPAMVENVKEKSIVTAFLNKGTFYAGPKEVKQLEKVGMGNAINFGVFGFLAKPLLKFFLLLHRFIPNWGLVIVLLTIIVKVILHPLTHKSFESMKKMQELAPRIEEVKKRYKNNPRKMNEEMIKLYREAGVNPMGGCLPILLQIPVFFALYGIFLNAVELKGASFLWVADLSKRDPTYAMPILMGFSMVVQQKLTPTTNPQQNRMFMLMAVVFTFMFATFPAGLVLYWLTNNLISAIQNLIIHETLKRKRG